MVISENKRYTGEISDIHRRYIVIQTCSLRIVAVPGQDDIIRMGDNTE